MPANPVRSDTIPRRRLPVGPLETVSERPANGTAPARGHVTASSVPKPFSPPTSRGGDPSPPDRGRRSCVDRRSCPKVMKRNGPLLHERGVDISHETVRFWWHRFGLRERIDL